MARKAKARSGKRAKPMGRPVYSPTAQERKQVQDLAAVGVQEVDIAHILGMSNNTLRKHFDDDLRRGRILANAKVGGALFKVASDPGHSKVVAAATFWLTHQAGWKPTGAGAAVQQPLGKKEAAMDAAQTAGLGSDWGDDLMTPPIPRSVN